MNAKGVRRSVDGEGKPLSANERDPPTASFSLTGGLLSRGAPRGRRRPDMTVMRSPATVAAAHRELERLLTSAPQNFHFEAEPSGLQGTVSPGRVPRKRLLRAQSASRNARFEALLIR